MSRCTVRIGSALALSALFGFVALCTSSARADETTFVFQGTPITFTRVMPQAYGKAVAADDPGLATLLNKLGATVTWQPGERDVLFTTAQPVVIGFTVGDRRYEVGPDAQRAAFAPFLSGGHAYVPLNELLHALDLSVKPEAGRYVLQPQLEPLQFANSAQGLRLVAHAGIPIDARVRDDGPQRVVLQFTGVGSSQPHLRTLGEGPVRRIEVRTEGTIAAPVTIVTLTLAPGVAHGAAGTDDQRDFTLAFNAAGTRAEQAPQAIAQSSPAPPGEAVTPAPSPQPVTVTGVDLQGQGSGAVVQIAVSGNATYEWHRLRPPDNRFWIDVQGAQLAGPLPDVSAAGPVTGLRVRPQNGGVRVALSLNDYQQIAVTPNASGVTISIAPQLADESAPRAGSGTVGSNAAVAQAPLSPAPSQSAPAPTPTHARNPRLIVIDPGHGGSDPGSYRGDAIEKNLTLDMAQRLRRILIARGWQVVMTRDSDRDVYAPNDSATQELQARDDVANGRGARLLVSIHVNAFMNAGPHGATAYYYKPVDLALARAVDRRIGTELGIKNDGVVKDKLYVVHHAVMPATLVETAFISNPDDRALLMSPDWRERMARAIADGITDYAGAPPASTTAERP